MTSSLSTIAGLFAGVGGIELGFSSAGFEVVSANEIDPYAAQTYALNHSHRLIIGDIADVTGNNLATDKHGDEKTIDVLTGGFPCQPFSVAGHRKGFDDSRGNVFWDIHRLIEELSPEVVFLENVKNLVGHDGGKTFATIKSSLEGCTPNPNGMTLSVPYFVASSVLNAKDFGVPQNRERLYIVAFKSKVAFERFTFPKAHANDVSNPKLSDFIDFESAVDEKYYYREDKSIFESLSREIVDPETVYQWRRHYVRANKSGLCPTLTANMGMGGHNVPLVLTKHGIRKLTPTECFRLMGISNAKFPSKIADSRLYKQAGNAVVVPVIEAIAASIQSALRRPFSEENQQ
jgi:DNA (cytosine-5)-methyltransferase 1